MSESTPIETREQAAANPRLQLLARVRRLQAPVDLLRVIAVDPADYKPAYTRRSHSCQQLADLIAVLEAKAGIVAEALDPGMEPWALNHLGDRGNDFGIPPWGLRESSDEEFAATSDTDKAHSCFTELSDQLVAIRAGLENVPEPTDFAMNVDRQLHELERSLAFRTLDLITLMTAELRALCMQEEII